MMNFRVSALTCLASLSLCALLAAPTAASVTFTSGTTHAWVADASNGNSDGDLLFGTTDMTAAASLPGFVSETIRVVESSGISASFNQARLNRTNSNSFGYTYMNFTVDTDVSYSLAGSFTTSLGGAFFRGYLYDLTTSAFLFDHSLHNQADGAFTAVLGKTSGNDGTYLIGDPAGELLAGHNYQWYAAAQTYGTTDAEGGATATGSAWLKFGDEPPTQVVPEPASIAVWSCLGLGAVGMTWVRRRKIADYPLLATPNA